MVHIFTEWCLRSTWKLRTDSICVKCTSKKIVKPLPCGLSWLTHFFNSWKHTKKFTETKSCRNDAKKFPETFISRHNICLLTPHDIVMLNTSCLMPKNYSLECISKIIIISIICWRSWFTRPFPTIRNLRSHFWFLHWTKLHKINEKTA